MNVLDQSTVAIFTDGSILDGIVGCEIHSPDQPILG